MPLLRSHGEVHTTGLSAKAPGAYAEHLLTQETLTLKVPNGLSPDVAVLTEPMAVGWHAVARGEVGKKDVAVVIGCGPVGLAVITILKSRGVRTIIASDLSPGRRALAKRCGADIVVDPTEGSPFANAKDYKHFTTAPATFDAALDAIDQMSKLPVGWWHAWRAADKLGATNPKAPVIFECVGNPGMIDSIMAGAPLFSRIVVVGVCMGADKIRPSMAINKEIDLRFVLGYTPLEFRDTLHALADGKIDASAMLTGRVGLDGVATAFDALGDPETHAKIVIDPRLDRVRRHSPTSCRAIVHTVLLDLDPARPAEIDAAIEALRSLAALPGVVSMVAGPNVSPEDLADGFTHAAVAVFESSAGPGCVPPSARASRRRTSASGLHASGDRHRRRGRLRRSRRPS